MNSPSPISSSTSSTATTSPGKTLLTPSRAMPPMGRSFLEGAGNGRPAATAAASTCTPSRSSASRSAPATGGGPWRTATAPGSSAIVGGGEPLGRVAEHAAGEHDAGPVERQVELRRARARLPAEHAALAGDDRLGDRVALRRRRRARTGASRSCSASASPPRRVNACSSAIASGAPKSASAPLGERRSAGPCPSAGVVDGAQALRGRGRARRRRRARSRRGTRARRRGARRRRCTCRSPPRCRSSPASRRAGRRSRR